MTTYKVYRMEHLLCTRQPDEFNPPFHGPSSGDCRSYAPLVFGLCGPLPPKDIQPYEFCGVTADQYPLWWEDGCFPVKRRLARQFKRANYAMVLYLILDDSHIRFINNQVLFNRDLALRQTVVDWELKEPSASKRLLPV